MSRTVSVYPLWVQFITYPAGSRGLPLTERGNTQETEFPWRAGACRIFRIPFTRRAIALGRWVGSLEDKDEEEPSLKMRPLPLWIGGSGKAGLRDLA
jgi:hypothetical protein